ncbi:MAG TPA: PQQ-dependent sugar dehydrogenase [Woeseiaceae bacterium]|nr:PQQ-dependent sugar dehydrogenase [Woeseiaceae bacterium]
MGATPESNLSVGERVYVEHCAGCHGQNMEGGLGSSFLDGIWNYGDFPGAIGLTVMTGVQGTEMPAWMGVLSQEEISSVVDYILQAEKKSGAEPPAIPEVIETSDYDVRVEVLADGLAKPWAIEFIDKKTALVTIASGELLVMRDGVIQGEPIQGLPQVFHRNNAGLMDVAVDPDYKTNGWVYLSYTHATDGPKQGDVPPLMTQVVRGKIQDGRWTVQETVFAAPPEYHIPSIAHMGSRISFDRRGYLYFSIGDYFFSISNYKPGDIGNPNDAQNLQLPNGKIHRVIPDGSIPADNPFTDLTGVAPSVFSYGHRNPQGLAFHPVSGELWSTEHGPMGGDELNVIRKGANYGWPLVTYGLNHDGSRFSELTAKEGTEQPIRYWTPSIGVSAIEFYRGGMFPEWNNNLLVASLKAKTLQRLVIEDETVVHSELLFAHFGRVRDLTVDEDGAIYVVLNTPGKILRLTRENK